MKLLGLTVLALGLSSCASTMQPVNGSIFSQVKGPMQTTQIPPGPKTGKACATSILGAVALGDASIRKAMTNGGITKVSTVDTDSFSVLGIYAQFCTVVHGS